MANQVIDWLGAISSAAGVGAAVEGSTSTRAASHPSLSRPARAVHEASGEWLLVSAPTGFGIE
jgi:hypothetical protein